VTIDVGDCAGEYTFRTCANSQTEADEKAQQVARKLFMPLCLQVTWLMIRSMPVCLGTALDQKAVNGLVIGVQKLVETQQTS